MEFKWDQAVDIIVIGAGTGGLSAAIEARKLGNSVLILEKMREGEFRSSLSVIVGVIAFAGTKYQKEMGIEDSPQKYAEDGVKYCGGSPELWKVMTDNLPKTLEFFENELNLKPKGIIGGEGHSVPRCHMIDGHKIIRALEDRAKEAGAGITWEHAAKELITISEKEVIGVIARYKDKDLYFKSNKAVIIATGGFGQNADLCREFGPDWLANAVRLMPPSHTGDGLVMALKLGAATRNIKYGPKASQPTCPYNKTGSTITYQGAIAVNKEGKRFIREDKFYGYITEEGVKQTGGRFYMIYDDSIRKVTKESLPMGLKHKEFKGDTIEALAQSLGIDGKALKAELEKYNADVKSKKHDTKFDRRTLDGNVGVPIPIDKPPFYGMECVASMTSFKGGIRIDPTARVVDWSDKPIPRLYAAGECTGGFFGAGKYVWGTMVPMSITMGRIAARGAVQEHPWS